MLLLLVGCLLLVVGCWLFVVVVVVVVMCSSWFGAIRASSWCVFFARLVGLCFGLGESLAESCMMLIVVRLVVVVFVKLCVVCCFVVLCFL